MFKLIDVNVNVGNVPKWVWIAGILLVSFFGTLYLVPEARDVVGQAISSPPSAALVKPATGSSPPRSNADAVCGPFKLEKSVKNKDGTVTHICN